MLQKLLISQRSRSDISLEPECQTQQWGITKGSGERKPDTSREQLSNFHMDHDPNLYRTLPATRMFKVLGAGEGVLMVWYTTLLSIKAA